MVNYEIGLIGLSVMGQNLALNIARNHSIAVYNRTESKTKDFMKNKVENQEITATYELEDFISSLAKPRKIMLMIKAGKPVDRPPGLRRAHDAGFHHPGGNRGQQCESDRASVPEQCTL
jgi:6-phosphogluconate dehydrogenase